MMEEQIPTMLTLALLHLSFQPIIVLVSNKFTLKVVKCNICYTD